MNSLYIITCCTILWIVISNEHTVNFVSFFYNDRLTARHTDVVNDPQIPDELMYGRSGYLHSLLFVQAHLGPEAIEEYIIDKV